MKKRGLPVVDDVPSAVGEQEWLSGLGRWWHAESHGADQFISVAVQALVVLYFIVILFVKTT